MSTSHDHTALVRDILAELGAMRGVVMGANPVGVAQYITEDGREFRVSYGWPGPGGPDILACVNGRLVALEVKTGKARLSPQQRACHAALKAAGAQVFVVRSVADARAAMHFMRGNPLERADFERMVDPDQ